GCDGRGRGSIPRGRSHPRRSAGGSDRRGAADLSLLPGTADRPDAPAPLPHGYCSRVRGRVQPPGHERARHRSGGASDDRYPAGEVARMLQALDGNTDPPPEYRPLIDRTVAALRAVADHRWYRDVAGDPAPDASVARRYLVQEGWRLLDTLLQERGEA